jgi:hypothetical protein
VLLRPFRSSLASAQNALENYGSSFLNITTNSKMLQVSSGSSETQIAESLIHNTSVFTWKNLTYTVKTPSGDRILLDDVQGWVKPGMLGAL